MDFTYEELAVIRDFNGSCLDALMNDLHEALPETYPSDIKQVMRSALAKLADMTDDDFDDLCWAMDDYGLGFGYDYDYDDAYILEDYE